MKFTYFWMWLNGTCCINTFKQNDRPLLEDNLDKRTPVLVVLANFQTSEEKQCLFDVTSEFR